MQRIAIARALYSERPILLLDEVTSALDEELELRILANIRKLPDRTVLMTTHRKKALEHADRIVVCKEKDGEYIWQMKK